MLVGGQKIAMTANSSFQGFPYKLDHSISLIQEANTPNPPTINGQIKEVDLSSEGENTHDKPKHIIQIMDSDYKLQSMQHLESVQ